jgi:galactokinase
MGSTDAMGRAVALYRERWGEPDLVVRAPGRVNLIGDHTDHNEGFTLPMALPFATVMALGSVGDPSIGSVMVVSEGFGEVTVDPGADPRAGETWARHIMGCVALLREAGVAAGGWRASVASDIPVGASLSSSSAVEVATITALLARSGTSWPPIEVARLGQRVENEVIGLPSGIMDQFISAGAVAGHASLMDCRAMTLSPTPLPDGVVVAIMDTGTRRVLADVGYSDRRAACARAADSLGVSALRDASLHDIAAIEDAVVRRRARHVVTENERTLDAAAAMERNDAIELGRLMTESHRSLRDDFEVSGPGLDAIVDIALTGPGCLGARMTGGGFAGCAVALVWMGDAAAFADFVRQRYSFGDHQAAVWICEPSDGASLVDPSAWPSRDRETGA